MSRTLTAADRSALIRLASTLPAGSDERRAILAGLEGSINRKSGGLIGTAVEIQLKEALQKTEAARTFLSHKGVYGALTRSVEDAATAVEKALREAMSTDF